MILKKCVNGTEQNCGKWEDEDLISLLEKEEALEEIVWNGLKMWHIILLSISAVLSLIILLCCCVKFRIPRTKQEIEADYIRRKILRKFRKRLKAIQNQELDEMDLKKALDKIRAEFKSDTESLAQSEAGFSAATLSSTGLPGVGLQGSTYRRASQIQIDISLEELRAHSLGLGARLRLAFSRLCGRSKVSQSDKVALTVCPDGETQLTLPEATFPTSSTKKGDEKKLETKKQETKKQGTKKEEKVADKSSTAPSTGGGGTTQVKAVQSTSAIIKNAPSTKKSDLEKKQAEKDEKERKKLEKEKEKAEKAKIKIENEKKKKMKKDEKLEKSKDELKSKEKQPAAPLNIKSDTKQGTTK